MTISALAGTVLYAGLLLTLGYLAHRVGEWAGEDTDHG